jgi:hypothetical protein
MVRLLLAILMTVVACLPPGLCTCLHTFCHQAKQASADENCKCCCADEAVTNAKTVSSISQINATYHPMGSGSKDHTPQCYLTKSKSGVIVVSSIMVMNTEIVAVLVVLPVVGCMSLDACLENHVSPDDPLFALVCRYLV